MHLKIVANQMDLRITELSFGFMAAAFMWGFHWQYQRVENGQPGDASKGSLMCFSPVSGQSRRLSR